MQKMKSDLNRKQFTPNDDVFGMASLIKRWLGELPVRIFEPVPLKDLDVSSILSLLTHLRTHTQIIWHMLFEQSQRVY